MIFPGGYVSVVFHKFSKNSLNYCSIKRVCDFVYNYFFYMHMFVYISFTESKDMTASIKFPPTEGLVKYDWIAAWTCISLFFLILTAFSVVETYVINTY